jgi:hypothetical protein
MNRPRRLDKGRRHLLRRLRDRAGGGTDPALDRVALPSVLGFVSIVAGVLIINQSLLPMWQLVLVAAGGALTAPIFALFYAIVARTSWPVSRIRNSSASRAKPFWSAGSSRTRGSG